MATRTIRIGLLGFGTVGQGVWKHLQEDRNALERRLGVKLEMTKASAKDLTKTRNVPIPKEQLTDDSHSIVADPDIDIICELIGGIELARELTLKAFEAGKIVVTANKALLCEHGEELFAAARAAGVPYYFEASVAGGIPIIKALREGLVANRFPLIYGILNGTSNYILTRMERDGLDFEPILDDARGLGYVEADESLDLDGIDAAHKAVILAQLAHGKWIKLSECVVEGIRQITAEDIAFARELGYKIKLLAIIRRDFSNNMVSVRLHPTLIKRTEMMAQVDDAFNGVSLTGDIVGTTLLVGRGAGQDATASAVISDVADAVTELLARSEAKATTPSNRFHAVPEEVGLAGPDQMQSPFYLRLHVKDQPGVLAQIAQQFADAQLSVASMIQKQGTEGTASLLFTTHVCTESVMMSAVAKVKLLDCVKEDPFILRVFTP